ncbi:hypothetical protein TUBRATIS_21940 [Tubulinosema ratisbonensis]|uniref:Uncharacterized protein n=1 Tax=Tubulinosema ratisbonensis TaxID=291195 RepID=A0A437AJW8_9MICR|nr:hypothetical protein TUBRATIS_21940 [Tubulinosema ratisbonensis]
MYKQKIKRRKYEPTIKDEYDPFITALKTLQFTNHELEKINLPVLKRKFEISDLIIQKIKDQKNWSKIIEIISILFSKLPEQTVNFFIESIYKHNKKNYNFIFELTKQIDCVPNCLLDLIFSYDESFLKVYFEKIDFFTFKKSFFRCVNKNISFIFDGLIKNKKINFSDLIHWLICQEDFCKILSLKLLNYFYRNKVLKGFNLQNISDTLQNKFNNSEEKSEENNFYKKIIENLHTKNDILLEEILYFLSLFKVNKEINDLIIEILLIRCKSDNITKLIVEILDISLLSPFYLDNLHKLINLNISLFLKILPQISLTEEMVNDLILLLSNTYDKKREFIYNLILPVITNKNIDTLIKGLEKDNTNSKLLLLKLINKIIQSVNEILFLNLCVILGNECEKKIIYEILFILKNKKNDWLKNNIFEKINKFTKIYLLVYPLVNVTKEYKERFDKFSDESVKEIIREFYQIK